MIRYINVFTVKMALKSKNKSTKKVSAKKTRETKLKKVSVIGLLKALRIEKNHNIHKSLENYFLRDAH